MGVGVALLLLIVFYLIFGPLADWWYFTVIPELEELWKEIKDIWREICARN